MTFPHVAFLKQVERETQRIRHLKKLILMFLRMAAIAALVLAFAGPYSPSGLTDKEHLPSVIFFDRSVSLDYHSGNTTYRDKLLSLLNASVIPGNTYALFDGEQWINAGDKDLVRLLQNNISHKVTDHKEVLRKINRKFPGGKQVYYFSDGQFFNRNAVDYIARDTQSSYSFVFLYPDAPVNLTVDTLFVKSQTAQRIYMEAVVSARGKNFNTVLKVTVGGKPVYSQLIHLQKNQKDTIGFYIERDFHSAGGIMELSDDPYFTPDNRLYFTIPGNKSKKVLLAGDSIPDFLKRLWQGNGVEYSVVRPDEVEWDRINRYDLVVLYGWKPFYNFSLIRSLSVPVIFVPSRSMETDLAFFKKIDPSFELKKGDFILNKIDENHPFFRDVFEKKIGQTQFPHTEEMFAASSFRSGLMASGEGYPAFFHTGNMYVFSFYPAYPVSGFSQSPLIIPLFFKPLLSRSDGFLYTYSDRKEPLLFPVENTGEEPVKLLGNSKEYTAYSVLRNGRWEVYIENLNLPPGLYLAVKGNDTLGTVAVNENRRESDLRYFNPEDVPAYEHIRLYENNFTESIPQRGLPRDYTRWFVLLALLFLLAELAVIKYWK